MKAVLLLCILVLGCEGILIYTDKTYVCSHVNSTFGLDYGSNSKYSWFAVNRRLHRLLLLEFSRRQLWHGFRRSNGHDRHGPTEFVFDVPSRKTGLVRTLWRVSWTRSCNKRERLAFFLSTTTTFGSRSRRSRIQGVRSITYAHCNGCHCRSRFQSWESCLSRLRRL